MTSYHGHWRCGCDESNSSYQECMKLYRDDHQCKEIIAKLLQYLRDDNLSSFIHDNRDTYEKIIVMWQEQESFKLYNEANVKIVADNYRALLRMHTVINII